MLKAECDRGKASIMTRGSILDICSDIGFLICDIYSVLLEQDKEGAEQFKSVMMTATLPFSPVWDPIRFSENSSPRVCIINGEGDQNE